MNTIGVGIIGASPGPTSWAANVHVPALQALSAYELRAVSTSRRASADAAAATFGVDAFDNAADLITHPDVDLVVVAVKVPEHHALVSAALAAGRMVYSEWPLGTDLAQARDLAARADAAGVRTAVGLQSRFVPEVRRIRELVDAGYVGDVLGTTIVGSGTSWGATTHRGQTYLFDAANGVTPLTASAAYGLDAIAFTLGELTRVTATAAVRRATVRIVDDGTDVPVTTPDHIALTGTLRSGAVVSAYYRGGVSRGENLRWEINGTDGDLVLTSPLANGNIQATQLVLAGGSGTATVVKELAQPVPDDPEVAAIPTPPARAVGGLYAALARDLRENRNEVPDFAAAVRMHAFLDTITAATAPERAVQVG
ncbi:Gfo/Idh/MocA family protein [Pseudonocardia xinjiangensis]|uniref:Gfo/Idh/MocA family protein n=1 Tax=Pseudonocardia xinjiangensis TaxID=75289 RepID=UPI001B7D1B13|nr:Gfo/Idh/MocA family oxidoreductase [Pseudonocardia xinjiangensis]